jgi:hypothetical protein
MNWITDDKGNRASVEFWGNEEAAKKSLTTLDGCHYCDNCSGCSGCSDCSDCSRCSRCSRCSGCSRCSDCSDCSGCSDCSDCSGCSGCSGCSDCSDCSGCSGCSDLENAALVRGSAAAIEIPRIEGIHGKVYAAASRPQALRMNNWHSCDTTHCRAGWVIHLAGEAGYALEKRFDPVCAAMRIYEASGFDISPCRFFDSNEAALADMKKLAEEEAALNQEPTR